MPRLTITILARNEPLRRYYVEHIWKLAGFIGGPIATYITDDKGEFEFDSSTHEADIRMLGQKSVTRIVEGGGALFTADLWVDRRVEAGTTIRLDNRQEKVKHFEILNKTIELYDAVHRNFAPFSALSDTAFPLGKKATLQKTKDQVTRIETVYPDNLGQELAFVEPKSVRTGYPLIHLKGPGQGAEDGSKPLSRELAHALHSAQLDDDARDKVEVDYKK
ncbi:hypothetical protein CLAFUW4_05410 [Fulvia fulva]|uniref:Uncharacterized protein n=1 Tax=Passalora fulva TaxID=5499 RepID=A0A9Q8LI57_PASFU|nr:uncharacterized protein CLAFUR5_05557 [Fulvia fulva]KAK4624429.1 hypothetical protein CLAFUR4_05404 [Fulvia fulva]KAK4625774.1 hypothetical protein CLAFUR0_05412 [Fulvia fulva]UJO17930.1 hypothetical protein CLAFUR5_05557 [Fulvia fulva]WPV15011.1 hypothetical protein CLAFUW4_05410 [Fulvia fulva]WPV29892.1 hypothetical protein CLAFUW7_05408 [Fulvia fulva]